MTTQEAEIPLQVSSQEMGMDAASIAGFLMWPYTTEGTTSSMERGTRMSGGSLESSEPSPYYFLDSVAGDNVYLVLFYWAWICLWLPPLFFLENTLFGINCPTSSPLCSYGQRVYTLGGNSRSNNPQGESQGHVSLDLQGDQASGYPVTLHSSSEHHTVQLPTPA